MGWWKKFNIHEKGKWLLGCRKLIIYAFNYDNSLQRNQSIQRNPITTSWWSASPGRWRSTSGSIIVHIWHSNDSVTDIGPANGAASLQAELFRIEAEDNSLVEVMITLEGLTLGSDSTLKPIFFFWGGGSVFFQTSQTCVSGRCQSFPVQYTEAEVLKPPDFQTSDRSGLLSLYQDRDCIQVCSTLGQCALWPPQDESGLVYHSPNQWGSLW